MRAHIYHMKGFNKDSFEYRNAELLLSGQYADFSLVCNEKSFKVHRSVICPQSAFFQKLCDGNFKEAGLGSAILEDEDPAVLGLILLYCYTGHYCILEENLDALRYEVWSEIKRSFGLYDKDYNFNGLSIHARMFAAGNRYLLSGLQTLAAQEYLYLDGADITQRAMDTWVLKGSRDLQDFLKSVETIYETALPGDTRMKERALLIAKYRPDVFNDQEAFKMVVAKYPEFAWAIAIKGGPAPADKGGPTLADKGGPTLADKGSPTQKPKGAERRGKCLYNGCNIM